MTPLARTLRRPRRAAAAALALVALYAAGRLLSPARRTSVAEFPRVRPADLAHLLADVSAHSFIPAPWSLEDEAGNYSSWRYEVAFTCGARCSGRAWVRAEGGEGAGVGGGEGLRHGALHKHRVQLRRRRCRSLPLMPVWPKLCDEIEIDWSVSEAAGPGGGARLQEQAQAQCGALASLLGACPAAALGSERDAHLRQLRHLLAAAPISH